MPVCVAVLDSPADLSPTVYPGFRREAWLTPGYARTAFQAEESRPQSEGISNIGRLMHVPRIVWVNELAEAVTTGITRAARVAQPSSRALPPPRVDPLVRRILRYPTAALGSPILAHASHDVAVSCSTPVPFRVYHPLAVLVKAVPYHRCS